VSKQRPKLDPATLRWVADEMERSKERCLDNAKRSAGPVWRRQARVLNRWRMMLRVEANRQEERAFLRGAKDGECLLCDTGEGDHICPEPYGDTPPIDPAADAIATLRQERARG